MQAIAQTPPHLMSNKSRNFTNLDLDNIWDLTKDSQTPDSVNGVFFIHHRCGSELEEISLNTVVNNVYYYEDLGEFFFNEFRFVPNGNVQSNNQNRQNEKPSSQELIDIFGKKIDFLYVNESDLITSSSFEAPQLFEQRLIEVNRTDEEIKLDWKPSDRTSFVEWTTLDGSGREIQSKTIRDLGSLVIKRPSIVRSANKVLISRYFVDELFGNYGESYLLILRSQALISLEKF